MGLGLLMSESSKEGGNKNRIAQLQFHDLDFVRIQMRVT